MPLPILTLVQRRQQSDSKRLRSMLIPSSSSSPIEERADFYSPISLFDRLPAELQIEIFSQCLQPHPHFDSSQAPLLISRICHAWRSLVISTPKLWSAFEIVVQGSGSSTSPHDLYIESSMKLWLARSRFCPLNVRVVHIPVGQVPDDRSARLLALLIPEARRWRYVELVLPTVNMTSLPTHFPALRSLSLQLKGLWTTRPSVDIPTMVGIPWHQLSCLDLQLGDNYLPSLDDNFFILSQTTRLRRCTISTDCSFDMNFEGLVLPLLEDFRLILRGQPSNLEDPALLLAKFLRLLTMPSLRGLDIIWLVQGPSHWAAHQLDFIFVLHRISSTLKTLSFAYVPVSEADLIDLLTPLSELTDLRLKFSLSAQDHDPITDRLLSALTPRDDDGDDTNVREGLLLPSLKALELQCNGSKFSYLALMTLVESRWEILGAAAASDHEGHFNHFRLLSMKPVLREVEKQVQSLSEEGLDIVVTNVFLR